MSKKKPHCVDIRALMFVRSLPKVIDPLYDYMMIACGARRDNTLFPTGPIKVLKEKSSVLVSYSDLLFQHDRYYSIVNGRYVRDVYGRKVKK